jgi:hypothetical protein
LQEEMGRSHLGGEITSEKRSRGCNALCVHVATATDLLKSSSNLKYLRIPILHHVMVMFYLSSA